MKKILYLIPLLIFLSCVPQSDYDKLKFDKEKLEQKVFQLENKLSDVQLEYNQLLEEKRQAEIEKNRLPYINESEAMQYIKDYYSFYEKDTRFRNIQLRRVSENSFNVSLEECKSFCDKNFFWHSRVRTLTVKNNGEYDF